MSKTELVEFVAAKAGLTKADAGRALDAVLEGVTKGLKKDGKVAFAKQVYEDMVLNGKNQAQGEIRLKYGSK